MSNLFVSTCGTSLFTNQTDDALRKLLIRNANAENPDDLNPAEKEQILAHIAGRAQLFASDMTSFGDLKKLSAELSSLSAYCGGELKNIGDHHVLVCTDTYLGEQAATILMNWLLHCGISVEKYRVSGMQTKKFSDFRLGMSELVHWCAETLPNYREKNYHIIFNLTGGFKSIQGFMQTLGMFYADESVYIFESSEQLLVLPRLPVELNARPIIEAHLHVFRRMAIGLTVAQTECAGIPDSLLLSDNGQAYLSPWGELLWQECYKSIYAEKLHPSISSRIRYSDSFTDTRLTHDRLVTLNERLDQLARCLESEQTYNPRSLDFKPLKTPSKRSSHEFDAWSDRGAYRGFSHFEGHVLVIDRLGPGLH